jgi:PleD family two-component response regulator
LESASKYKIVGETNSNLQFILSTCTLCTFEQVTHLSGKILLVDDEEKLRSLLARLLKLDGYDIVEAGNLRGLIKLLKQMNRM